MSITLVACYRLSRKLWTFIRELLLANASECFCWSVYAKQLEGYTIRNGGIAISVLGNCEKGDPAANQVR